MKEALVADLKLVHSIHGKISRKLYRVHGTYSENQLRKHFGSFGLAVEAAFGKQAAPVETAESSEIVGDTWNLNIPNSNIESLAQLVEHCKVDQTIWKTHRFALVKRELRNGQAFDVRATFIRNPDIEIIQTEIADLKAEAKKDFLYPLLSYTREQVQPTGNMLELNIPDLHLGKLAWSKETGYQNYDTKIALETFKTALDDLLSKASGYSFDSILFVIGNDLLNSDNAEGTTTSGTHVSNDGRYHKTFIAARNMLKDAILKLRAIAPIKVVSCPGNHDRLAAWHVADSLEMYFTDYPNVEVDNSPKTRKYHQYGKNLLMFTHGDQGKRDKLALTMAAEEPKMWGETKYRECHTGHIHQTKTEEYCGVRVRILPALCPPDAWHSANAFVGNLRAAEAYVWNKDKGLVAQFFHNAD